MLTDAPLHAILFDVGGPIVVEAPGYVRGFKTIKSLLQRELGRDVSDQELDRAREQAIESWSPSFTKAVLWYFLKPDREKTLEVYQEALFGFFTNRDGLELTEGIVELVRNLAKKYILAIAGNQPAFMREQLDRTGLMKYFESTAISGEIGLHKPDSRFFLEICSRIDTPAENCCMIGDRLDNDIYPANILGMRTIRLRIGPHAVQHPRVPEDVPDATIENMTDVQKIIESWEGEK